MTELIEFAAYSIFIGAGATMLTDVWALVMKRLFGIPSMNWAMVGRWFGHMPEGRFMHESIGKTAPVRGELALGWVVHYATGIVYAGVLLLLWGLDWARLPTLMPALIVGWTTIAAPFFLMQPGLGLGIAAAKTPKPLVARLRSLLTHTVFGLGLYGAACLMTILLG